MYASRLLAERQNELVSVPNVAVHLSMYLLSHCSIIVTLSPGRRAKYCDERVCLSVCPLAYLKECTSKLHEIFHTC